MIFELVSANEDTICIAMDYDTFATIHKMLVVAAYHKGQREPNRDPSEDE